MWCVLMIAGWIPASADEWVAVGPVGVHAVTDVAVAEDPGAWAVVGEAGDVWVTADSGSRWHRVLAPLADSGADTLAAEVEARLAELAPDVELPDPEGGEYDPDELADALQAAADDASSEARQAVDDVRSELAAGPSAPASPNPRVWFAGSGLLVVARVDGLRLSADGGATWSLALHEPVTAWAELPDGGALAGTPRGLLRSTRAVDVWTPVGRLAGVPVTDLVGPTACTAAGVWVADGPDWRPSGESDPLWLARDGRLWSVSSSAIARTVSHPVSDVEVRGELVLVASTEGLMRRVPVVQASGPIRLADRVPLGVLVEASTGREPAVAPGRRLAAGLLPELSVEVGWLQGVGDDWNADSWTIRGVDTTWDVHGVLTWRAGAVADPFDGDEVVEDVELVVFDDEVVVDDGSATWLLAAKVARGARVDTADLASTVSGLYVQQQRLLLEPDPVDEPLIDRVRRALWVAEIDARLDALTDGAVSAWNTESDRNRGVDE